MKISYIILNRQFKLQVIEFLLFIAIILNIFTGCKKDEIKDNQASTSDTMRISFRIPTLLESLSEKDLTIPSGECIYHDEQGNEDINFEFDHNHVRHLFEINLEEDKCYRFSMILEGPYEYDFLLLNSDNDTISIGIENISPFGRHINWTPSETGTYYISSRVLRTINFQTLSSCLVIEEVKHQDLSIDGFNFACSGDWFISNQGYLALAMHKSGMHNWAILKTEIDSCQFSFYVSQASGFFRGAVGFTCFASENLVEEYNIPKKGYDFYIKGPCDWRFEHNGWCENGEIPQNLPMGTSYWYNLGFKTDNNRIFYLYNNEIMYTSSHDNTYKKFYLMVNDTEKDTVYFKHFTLLESSASKRLI